MGYLDNSAIRVDAILTKKGRELLAQGRGNFNITQFALSDDEVDYSLWNPSNPLGSDYFGSIIENMPVTEAIPDETQSMKYKLITLEKSTVAIPYINFVKPGGSSLTISFTTQPTDGTLIEFETRQYTGQIGGNVLQNQTYSATILDTTYMDLLPYNAGSGVKTSTSGNSKTLSGLSTSNIQTNVVSLLVKGKELQEIVSGQSKSTKIIITNELYGSRFVLPVTYTR